MRLLVIFSTFLSAVTSQEELFDYKQFSNAVDAHLATVSDSNTCSQQLRELRQNNPRAFYDLFDSTSKFPWTGLLTSNLVDWGNYDQCVDINHDGWITGKHCIYGIFLPTSIVPSSVPDFNRSEVFGLSLCMPNACTASDYNSIFRNVSLFYDGQCSTKEDLKKYTPGDFIMIVVLALFGLLMTISTTYDVCMHRKQKKVTNPMYVAFSIFSNGRKLLQTSRANKEQIQIFNGIKTISMAWIIAGHAFGGWNQFSVINRHIVDNYLKYLRVAYISTSLLAVDSFFYISGFLLAYLYMKHKSKPLGMQIQNIPKLIVHRYFRITPAVAMMYFFTITVYKHLGSGPLWRAGIDQITKPCLTYWWSFFLYIQNYYNYDDYCLIPTWYLSADMQMFLISPIIIIPMAVLLAKNSKNLNLVMMLMACVNLFFILQPMAFKLIYTDYTNLYDTHSRMISYTMGMMLGIYMRETKDKPSFFGKMKHPSLINLLIWTFMLLLMFTISLIQQEITLLNGYSHTAVSITLSLMRPAWCTVLSWMVYSSYHGYGGIVNWILTRPTLQITSKLSYCMYLMHGLVVVHFVLLTRTRIWFHDYIAYINWCGFFMTTFVVSIIWSLSFESPLMIIEKMVFGGGTSRKPKEKRPSQNVAAQNGQDTEIKQV